MGRANPVIYVVGSLVLYIMEIAKSGYLFSQVAMDGNVKTLERMRRVWLCQDSCLSNIDFQACTLNAFTKVSADSCRSTGEMAGEKLLSAYWSSKMFASDVFDRAFRRHRRVLRWAHRPAWDRWQLGMMVRWKSRGWRSSSFHRADPTLVGQSVEGNRTSQALPRGQHGGIESQNQRPCTGQSSCRAQKIMSAVPWSSGRTDWGRIDSQRLWRHLRRIWAKIFPVMENREMPR